MPNRPAHLSATGHLYRQHLSKAIGFCSFPSRQLGPLLFHNNSLTWTHPHTQSTAITFVEINASYALLQADRSIEAAFLAVPTAVARRLLNCSLHRRSPLQLPGGNNLFQDGPSEIINSRVSFAPHEFLYSHCYFTKNSIALGINSGAHLNRGATYHCGIPKIIVR